MRETKSTSALSRFWTITVVALVSLLLFYATGYLTTIQDCFWSAPATAWVDENGNGLKDDDDTALSGVRFTVNDRHNHYQNVGDPAVSDTQGIAELLVWLPGCPSARFEVLTTAPSGYIALQSEPVVVSGWGYGSNETLSFGFRRQR